jgi:hypothetical protein
MEMKKYSSLVILFIFFIIPGIAGGQGQKETPSRGSSGTAITAKAAAPEKDFQQARESFLKKDLKVSAEAIRQAASHLNSLEQKTVEKGEQSLAESIESLRQLAARVEKGTVKSVKELDRVFSRVHQTLARHHYLKATETWAKKETTRTGQELRAASDSLESVLKRARKKVQKGTYTTIQETRRLAGKMIEGTAVASAEVEKGLAALGKEIDQLAKKVKPAQSK